MYRIFNTAFHCDFPLPELPESTDGVAVFSVSLGSLDQAALTGFERSFEWCDHNGQVLCWCERQDHDYLYVFPGFAGYLVTSEAVISCLPHEDCTMQMLRHLLLNQIIPRYLATIGKLVLHASAVTLNNSSSIAFLGNSGYGKSTLASSFHRYGAQLISDDCIQVDSDEHRVTAIGGVPEIRLFPDSMNAVFNESTGFTKYTPYTDKQQLVLRHEINEVVSTPRALKAIFLLNDPVNSPWNDEVLISPASGSTAIMAMINCAFSLDPSERKMVVRNFQSIGQAVSEHLSVFSLDFQRKHDGLSLVRRAVTDCVSKLS